MSTILGVPDHARTQWAVLGEALNNAGATAPCQGTAPDYWQGDAEDQAYAARACLDCPAMTACAAYALTAGEPAGTWGGLTSTDRRKTNR